MQDDDEVEKGKDGKKGKAQANTTILFITNAIILVDVVVSVLTEDVEKLKWMCFVDLVIVRYFAS